MSSGTPGTLSVNKTAESPVSGSGNKRRDSLGSPSSCPIFKDVGEIYSRLLDHRPVIQGEIRYFIKEFEEKRSLRELRILENMNHTVFEANDKILPKCEGIMHENLNEILKKCDKFHLTNGGLRLFSHQILKLINNYQLRTAIENIVSFGSYLALNNSMTYPLQVTNQMFNTLQQTEQEERKFQAEKLRAGEAQRRADWEQFIKEQHQLKTTVNEEHTKAMQHLKEQYEALEKDLPKQAL